MVRYEAHYQKYLRVKFMESKIEDDQEVTTSHKPAKTLGYRHTVN